jgi:hypothetical protein
VRQLLDITSLKESRMNVNLSTQIRFRLALVGLLIVMAVPVSAAGIPDSPDGTVLAVAEALADHHPEIIWQALPPSYQQDITELTHTFAARMDPTVWDAAFGLGRKLTGILRDKKALILDSSMLESAGDNRETIEDNWDTTVSVLGSFFESDVTRLESLKTIDWERYLSTTGRDLMNLAANASTSSGDNAYERDFKEKLRKMKVEVVSLDGEQASLRITAPDEEPEEVELTRVEGRWIPSDLAKDWEKDVAEAKQKLADLTDEEIQEGSMQAMMVIGMIDGALTEIESVDTTEELEQALQGLLGPLMGGMMQPGEPVPEGDGAGAADAPATTE